jgi:Ser/Thr protein kinase RdoA (MazF antagonist)
MSDDSYKAHGMQGSMVEPDWPRLTLAELDRLLRGYPQIGGALELLSFSPRPFSAGSVVATPIGSVFVKRHHRSVRDREGLLEEHRFIEHLHAASPEGESLVQPVLANSDGETVVIDGDWSYEVHTLARGVDVYEQALSWTPFLSNDHARSAGRALAKFHSAAKSYPAPARSPRQLVTSFSIFASDDPLARTHEYLALRPNLQEYAELRDWRSDFEKLLMPYYRELQPYLANLSPLWTHNDLHASNLMWSNAGTNAEATGIIDFGLSDRTNAVHDLATAIERNIVEWLRMDDTNTDLIHFDHLDELLAGYEELSPLSHEEARALVAMLPIVHCEFALSETDYFLTILHSEEKAFLAYEGYFVAHARWFGSKQGLKLLAHLERWAEMPTRMNAINKAMNCAVSQ